MAKRDRKREENRKKAISFIITLFMLFGTIAYYIVNYMSSIKSYEGVRFHNSDGVWSANVGGSKITFYTAPEEFLSLRIPNESVREIASKKTVYVAFDPNSTEQFLAAVDEVSLELATFLMEKGISLQRGVLQKNDRYKIPILNCSYAPVLMLREANSSEITGSPECLEFRAGNIRELFMLRDLIEFKISKEMQGGN